MPTVMPYRRLAARTALCAAAFSAAVLASPAAPAFAQGFFDFFWGHRGAERDWNERNIIQGRERGRENLNEHTNNGPSDQLHDHTSDVPAQRPTTQSIRKRLRAPTPSREESEPAPVAASGPPVSFCVRLCDGRYFPIQRSGAEPADICNAFCPAAKTKIYSGIAIEQAVANDGKRYSKLDTAFVFRDRVVPDCTCNGTNPFGVARLDVNKDPTLRAGDIVVRDGRLMAFKGAKKPTYTAGDFTPVQTYAKSDNRLRKRFSGVKVAPPRDANLSAGQGHANASAESQNAQPSQPRRRGNQPSR